MNYTPYDNMTNEEIVLSVANDPDATQKEVSMMVRIDDLLEERETLTERIAAFEEAEQERLMDAAL